MPHDFIKFPELRNNQMAIYYFESPHKQIMESFNAEVKRVKDGDTVVLRWEERDFDFPLRMAKINAPEIKDLGGEASKTWLQERVLNQEVLIEINPNNRVGKFGRLIGDIILGGESMSEASLRDGQSVIFGLLPDGEIPEFEVFVQ